MIINEILRRYLIGALLVLSTKVLLATNGTAAYPNFNIKVEEQLLQEEISDIKELERLEEDKVTFTDASEIRNRNKIEARVLEIANDIASNKRASQSVLGATKDAAESTNKLSHLGYVRWYCV